MSRYQKKIALVGGARTPFVKANTTLAPYDAIQMGAVAVNGVGNKFALNLNKPDLLVYGTVAQHPLVSNIAREILFETMLPSETPAYSVIHACATAMQAITDVSDRIALGKARMGVAGGTESMSNVPMAASEGMAKALLQANFAKGTMAKLGALSHIRPSHLMPVAPAIAERSTGKTMGQHTETMAKNWGVTRLEQDEWSVRSHKNAAKAQAEGFFAQDIVTMGKADKDNLIREDTSVEKLSTLKPAFDKTSGGGTLTAGNSSGLTDGAAAVLMADEDYARSLDLPILARLVDYEYAAIEIRNEDLLIAPAYAMARMLARNNLKFSDIDAFEFHEAFAAQVIATFKALESREFLTKKAGLDKDLGQIDRNKVNTRGGSLALGHPLAATGARVALNLARILNADSGKYGVLSICAAGGLGVVALFERP